MEGGWYKRTSASISLFGHFFVPHLTVLSITIYVPLSFCRVLPRLIFNKPSIIVSFCRLQFYHTYEYFLSYEAIQVHAYLNEYAKYKES